MESKEKIPRAGLFTPAAAIALGCALAGLLLSTFMLCNTFMQQFCRQSYWDCSCCSRFFVIRMRWAKKHDWLFYSLCVVFAVVCGFVIRAIF
ncbi:MAG: hypothetical protein R2912_07505 [Eubacteriales bacterium]